jgi:threonine synthase
MGVPVSTIIVATNQNDVLDRFIKTGIYEKAPKVLPSSSPSMDIQVASNFERLYFELTGREGELVGDAFDELAKSGRFDGRHVLPSFVVGWESGSASETEVLDTIRGVHHKYGRIIDPHTAVGTKVGLEHRRTNVPLVIAETARPEKFPDVMREAIPGVVIPVPLAWRHLEASRERVYEIGVDAEAVKDHIRQTF